MSSLKTVVEHLWSKAIAGSIVFVVPAYAIKWGQLHPHTNWAKYLTSAWAVGLANSPLGHREFYGAHFHWQELACLLIYISVWLQAEYLLTCYGGAPAKVKWPRSRAQLKALLADQDGTLINGTMLCVFLFVAACALCERIQLGTMSGIAYESYIRDLGIVIETYLLFQTITILSAAVRFNGMVVRTDIERCYFLVIWSLGGLALSFATWFPLLALPGARIATKWVFNALAENNRMEAVAAGSDNEDGLDSLE